MLRLFTSSLLEKNSRALPQALRRCVVRDAAAKTPSARHRFPGPAALRVIRGLPRAWVWWALSGVILSGLIAHELRTSALQSRVLTRYATQLSYRVDAGPSSRIVFPESGPYDQRLGNALLPDFTRRLDSEGFRVIEQARMSEPMARLARARIAPPYREPAAAGLVVRAQHGEDDIRRSSRRVAL